MNRKLSKQFWNRFEVYHTDLKRKRQGTASKKRVFACSEEMVRVYFDELAEELIKLEIFTDANKIESDVWDGKLDLTRIFNHDEMSQFIDYGTSSNTGVGLVYCGSGERCQKMRDTNRVCYHRTFYLTCWRYFPATCIMSNMAPEAVVEKIPNLLISTSKSGYQNGRNCLATYKNFEAAIREKGKSS